MLVVLEMSLVDGVVIVVILDVMSACVAMVLTLGMVLMGAALLDDTSVTFTLDIDGVHTVESK